MLCSSPLFATRASTHPITSRGRRLAKVNHRWMLLRLDLPYTDCKYDEAFSHLVSPGNMSATEVTAFTWSAMVAAKYLLFSSV